MKKHGFVFVLLVFLLLLTACSGLKSSDSLGKDSVSPSSYSTQYSADSPEEFKKALRAFGYYDVEEFEELLREWDLPTEGYLDGYRDSDPKYSSDEFRFGVMLKQLNCKGLIDEQDHSTLYIVRNMTERTQELCWYLFDWDLDNTGKELVYLTFPDPAIAKTTFNWAISGLEDSMNSEEHMVITTKDAYSRATLIEQDEEDKEDGWAFSMVLVQDGNHLILYVGPVYCHAYQLFDFLGYTQDSSDLLGEPIRTEKPETVSDFETTPEPEPEDENNSWPPLPLASTVIVAPSDQAIWFNGAQTRIITAEKGAYQFAAPDDYSERFSTVKKGTVVEMIAQEGAFGLCVKEGQILGWIRTKNLGVG